MTNCANDPTCTHVSQSPLTPTAMTAPIAHALNRIQREHLARKDETEAKEALAAAVGTDVVEHDGRVGGGGAPGVPLPGWAVRLPEAAARPLRLGTPAVLPRVHDGACLVDPRCVPEERDTDLLAAVRAALAEVG